MSYLTYTILYHNKKNIIVFSSELQTTQQVKAYVVFVIFETARKSRWKTVKYPEGYRDRGWEFEYKRNASLVNLKLFI